MIKKSSLMNLILQGPKGALWLGCLEAAQNLKLLRSKGIKTVITILNKYEINYPQSEQIIHHTYDVPDIPHYQIDQHFVQTTKQIEEGLNKGSVLVHCVAGLSRSVSLIIAFLIITKGWGFEKAFMYVSQRRDINPNPGFKQQLMKLAKEQEQKKRTNLQLQEQSFASNLLYAPSSTKSRLNQGPTTMDTKYFMFSDKANPKKSTEKSTLRKYSSAQNIQFQEIDSKLKDDCTRRLHQNYLKYLSSEMENTNQTIQIDPKSPAIQKKLRSIALFDPELKSPGRTTPIIRSERPVPKFNAAYLYKSTLQI